MNPALSAGSTVALLGADSSGKRGLAGALAARLRPHGVTVADDTLLGQAVARALLHGDHSLLDDALAAHRRHARTLLVGLEPSAADALGPAALQHERADTLLRAALVGAGLSFAVIHGRADERLANALRALGLEAPEGPRRLARWDCDKCSDPACEHRLFTDLVRQRVDAGTAS